ncbi:MAG TPA: Uma2 family endonuclease [Gemmataceae bacterium]|jgi:Uma2 family endonuclease|nr:Uma2 family endonuclease [Gemmataceae bacterium]
MLREPSRRIPPLENGDRLTRAEFERRYTAMPHLKKAELIEGVVYVPSPVSFEQHGGQHADVMTWLGVYWAATPGVQVGDNTTVVLEGDNEPQPDALLRIAPTHGGQSRTIEGGYVEGAPELIVEVTATSASYDLHDKLDVYRRHHVREYLVWRVLDEAIDWFILRRGRFKRLPLASGNVYRSETFPGLWLDAAALVHGDLGRVLQVLQQGIASAEHAAFVTRLQQAAARRRP